MNKEKRDKEDLKEVENGSERKTIYAKPELKKYHNFKASVLQDEGFVFSFEVPSLED